MAYLNDHPPRRSQFRRPRRQQPSGVTVVHTAENTPDFVAFDGGAEAVARFIQGRDTPGSYHDLVDSDSTINLVDYADEAFHDGTGTNPHSYGLSVATRADVWPLAPKAWRDGAIEQAAQAAARYARWVKGLYGITIPARRITAAQARNRVPGFTTHGELDPGRRTDPGAGFPWTQFLTRFAQLTTPTPTEDDDMALILRGDKTMHWWVTDGVTKRHVRHVDHAAELVYVGLARWNKNTAFVVPQRMVDSIPTVAEDKSWPTAKGY